MTNWRRLVLASIGIATGCTCFQPADPQPSTDETHLQVLIENLGNRKSIFQSVIELRKYMPQARALLTAHFDNPDPLVRKVCVGLLAEPMPDFDWYARAGLTGLDLQMEHWHRWLRESGCGNAILDSQFGLNTIRLLRTGETCTYDSERNRFVLSAPAPGRHWEEVAVVCSDSMSQWSGQLHERLNGIDGPVAFITLIEYVQEIGGDLWLNRSGELVIHTKSDAFSQWWGPDSRAQWRPDVANGPAVLVLDVLNDCEWLRISESEFINLRDNHKMP